MLVRIAKLLYYYTKDKKYLAIAEDGMKYLLMPTIVNNVSPATLLLADMRMKNAPLEVTVVGEKDDPSAKKLYAAALSYPSFYYYLTWTDKKNEIFPLLNQAAAYVCVNNRCSIPIFTENDLTNMIQQLIVDPLKMMPIPQQQMKQSLSHTHPIVINQHIVPGLEIKNAALIILIFYFLGILLSLTPCVFPLLLVSAMLINSGGNALPKKQVLKLCITYVVSLAVTYALAGIVAGLCGIYIQGYLQVPWIICTLSLVIFILALSMFDAYKIQVPAKLHHYLVKFNNTRFASSYLGVAFMGVLATLIAAPCAAAPFIGALGYISEQHNIMLGGTALFFAGLGLGSPLLL